MNPVKVSIIVPVYNEQGNLLELHEEIEGALKTWGHSFEVIYVDDGSEDGSYETLLSLHRRFPVKITVIRLRRNFGQTAAMAAGFEAASGEIVVPLDADLQNDPGDIPNLVGKLEEGYDLVSGWRVNRQDKAFTRLLPSRVANAVISRITGVKLHDYGCTIKAYHRGVVAHLKLYGEMHRFLPALASWNGARIAEIPVNHRPRKHGVSKYGLGRTLRVLTDLATVKFLLSYSTKPMQVFGKWGFLSIFSGFAAGILMLLEKVFPPYQDVTDSPWMLICFFFLLGGMQLIGLGFLGELNVRTYYESQQKAIYTVREMVKREERADEA